MIARSIPGSFNIISIWCLLGILALPELARAAEAVVPARPNIILILADDFGYECVRANGGDSYQTPRLDRLAREGARFEHCFAQPLCTPTRVQLLTGLYNQRNYVRFAHLDSGETTLAQILKQAGYRTAVAGKWQLGGGADAPRRFGFDEHLLWQLSSMGPRYANPLLEQDGRLVAHPGKYGPDLMTAFAGDFIRRNREGPFFLFYPMILTHPPFEATPDSAGWDPRARGAEAGKRDPRHFPAMVAYADKEVGKIVDLLDELHLRERTLVLFIGDNGSPPSVVSRLGAREVKGGKGTMADAGTRVPLIASWSGVIPGGKTLDDLVDSTDFFPTILEAAGVSIPGRRPLDGRSFLPQLRGEKGRPREWVYSWFSRDGGPKGAESARDLRFRLHGDGRFFDVLLDPEESRDLTRGVLSDSAAAARERLARVLESFKGTRPARFGMAPARGAGAGAEDPDEAVKRIEEIGGQLFRKDGRIVEVVLNRRPVTDEVMRLLSRLPDLTDLSLEETPVGDAGVALLASHPKIEWLNLYRTQVGDAGLEQLSRIGSLKHLPIGETRVTDRGLVSVGRMAGLEYLGLRGNRITDAGLAQLGNLRGLRGLHLGETSVGDAGLPHLAGLEKLESLWLDRTAVTDAAVVHLARFRSLKELHLTGTKLTPRGIEALRGALPGLKVELDR